MEVFHVLNQLLLVTVVFIVYDILAKINGRNKWYHDLFSEMNKSIPSRNDKRTRYSVLVLNQPNILEDMLKSFFFSLSVSPLPSLQVHVGCKWTHILIISFVVAPSQFFYKQANHTVMDPLWLAIALISVQQSVEAEHNLPQWPVKPTWPPTISKVTSNLHQSDLLVSRMNSVYLQKNVFSGRTLGLLSEVLCNNL